MEYLTRKLKNLQRNSDYNFHPKCAKMQIIQLSFVDDLLIFSRGDMRSIRLLMDCFNEFSRCSGMIANKDKSFIYIGGVSREMQEEILAVSEFAKGELSIKYLRVPLSYKQISILIKNVLFSIQVFWSQIFVLPEKIVKVIEATCRSFLWTGTTEISRRALLAWKKVSVKSWHIKRVKSINESDKLVFVYNGFEKVE
ncbi:uncharacterized protein LOC142179890 [Nicotiana tabacum]|uniref:Uncharacterized protein LOC142179890 n=1 Tax=Nicotiana tabacum TaxID=4097 RepID=A0AC58UBL8_TOBAC